MDFVFILIGFIFELHVRALLAWLTLLSSIPLVSPEVLVSRVQGDGKKIRSTSYTLYQVSGQLVRFIADAACVSYSVYLPAAPRMDAPNLCSEEDARMPGYLDALMRSSVQNAVGFTPKPVARAFPVHVHAHTLSGPINTQSILAKYPKEWHQSLERIYVGPSPGAKSFRIAMPQASSRVQPCVQAVASPRINIISEHDHGSAGSSQSSTPSSPREKATTVEQAQMWSFRFPMASPNPISLLAVSEPRTPHQYGHIASNDTFGSDDRNGALQSNHVVNAPPRGDTVQHEHHQVSSMDSDVFDPSKYEDEEDIDLSQYSAESLGEFYHDLDSADDSDAVLTFVPGSPPQDSSGVEPAASVSSSGSSNDHVSVSFSLDDVACVGNFKSLMQSIASMEPISVPVSE